MKEDSKKNRTKDRIINAALDEFIASGIRESSIDRIAVRADVVRRTVYNHFSDRDELLKAVVDSRLESAIAEVKVLGSRSCSIDELAGFCLRFRHEDPRFIMLIRKLQEERVAEFSDLHGIFLGELKQLLAEVSKKTPLRFSEPDVSLRLIFVSLFPMLEVISGQPGYEEHFRLNFKQMLTQD